MSTAVAPVRPGVALTRSTVALAYKTDTARPSRFSLWGDDGLTLGDLADAVNPLQHLPLVATVYRALSGDTIAPAPRLLGGALFGGIIGLAAAAANTLLEQITGKDAGRHLLALFHTSQPATDAARAHSPPAPTLPVSPPVLSKPVPTIPSPPSAKPVADRRGSSSDPLAGTVRQLHRLAALETYARGHALLAACPQ